MYAGRPETIRMTAYVNSVITKMNAADMKVMINMFYSGRRAVVAARHRICIGGNLL